MIIVGVDEEIELLKRVISGSRAKMILPSSWFIGYTTEKSQPLIRSFFLGLYPSDLESRGGKSCYQVGFHAPCAAGRRPTSSFWGRLSDAFTGSERTSLNAVCLSDRQLIQGLVLSPIRWIL